ncbi:hypothetical protein [uncultured Tateyamaria sp.]|uniref:hypothetical protein n=1 Tax=uncultured Tateyamaria sp. TaxID=455651 RepID=UPI00260EE2F4|nr:hypothetical protein [uncultured Tateyamaria sp.]
MMMTAQMSAVGSSFPMHDPRAVLEELKRTLRSLRAYLWPFGTSMLSIPRPHLASMTMAARMTLSLRAQGLCPMALSGVDMSYSNAMNLGCPHTTLNAAIGVHAGLGTAQFPAFGMSMPQLNLAMTLAALAPLADAPMTLGLPAISDPGFGDAAMDLLSGLGGIPPLPFDISQLLEHLTMISDLSAITEAFGPDAMSPAGIGRVQAMLNYMFGLRLPALPSAALSLQPKLDMLPSMDNVLAGAAVAQNGANTFAASMRFNPSLPVILPFLSVLDALKAMLGHAFGGMPTACSLCRVAA